MDAPGPETYFKEPAFIVFDFSGTAPSYPVLMVTKDVEEARTCAREAVTEGLPNDRVQI